MKNKTNWINIGISAAAYGAGLAAALLIAEIENLEPVGIIIGLLIFLTGGVYTVYRSGKVMLFPVTGLTCHVLVCALAIIGVYLDLDALISTPPEEQGAALMLFTTIGGSLLFAVFIIAAIVSAIVIFLVSLLTAYISNKAFSKYRTTV